MTFQILISCMHQKGLQMIEHSHITCDAVVINQCDENRVEFSEDKRQKVISTVQRGLSNSRNMAIDNATADVCLISDDDEVFVDDVEQRILKAYSDYPNADIIAFQVDNGSGFGENVKNDKKVYPTKAFECGLIKSLRISSWQISFKKKSIIDKGIRFDTMMGSGTGHGGQEESKFLADCLKAGLRIWYVPVLIARMDDSHPSQWFHGFDKKFFFDRGWATRRFLGWNLATLYAVYYAIKKYRMYSTDISFVSALINMIKGINSPLERK